MTTLLTILTITLIIMDASPWVIGIVTACTIWALTLDTRATITNRRDNT